MKNPPQKQNKDTIYCNYCAENGFTCVMPAKWLVQYKQKANTSQEKDISCVSCSKHLGLMVSPSATNKVYRF